MNRISTATVVTGAVILQCWAVSTSASDQDETFWQQNTAAMSRMMAAMAISSSGEVDRDFVRLMIPHHQGAIDMAKLELRYGHTPALRRLAQEIIVTQQSEIEAMQSALVDSASPGEQHNTEAGAAR